MCYYFQKLHKKNKILFYRKKTHKIPRHLKMPIKTAITVYKIEIMRSSIVLC